MTEEVKSRVLVSTEWVDKNRSDEKVRIVEVDVDTAAYEEAHIEGAVGWNWTTDLCDTVRRDIVPQDQLQDLLRRSGIANDTAIILYGDNNNWFACWAYWQLKMYGHADIRIMDGGRKKWIEEERDMTKVAPAYPESDYTLGTPDFSLRAFLPLAMEAEQNKDTWAMVDVRSPDEFTGRILAPPGLPETCQRGGHIPGAANIPWGKNCNEDGTFKSTEELKKMYEEKGIVPDKNVIAYCRIGERSSLSWFVLKELLGYPNVFNYDGSWTEWGNLVNAPVERGE